MNLLISLSRDNEKWYLYLSEKESTPFKIVIAESDISQIITKEWFSTLKENDTDQKIQTLTSNQFIVLLYFFLLPQTPSIFIMNRWLSDTGCETSLSNYLSNLVHYSRMNESYDPDKFYEAVCGNTYTENIYCFNNFETNDKTIWNFELFSESGNQKQAKVADLISIRETYFMIEDHAYIIIGFSVNYTSFIEVISGYQPSILDSLCKLVPLQFRDVKTIGQILSQNHEIEEIIKKTFPIGIEFYGITNKGKLINYNLLVRNSHGELNYENLMLMISQNVTIIPLFIKFIK